MPAELIYVPDDRHYMRRWIIGSLVVVAVLVVGLGIALRFMSRPASSAPTATEAPRVKLTRVLRSGQGIDVRFKVEGGKGASTTVVTVSLPDHPECGSVSSAPISWSGTNYDGPEPESNILVWQGDCGGYRPQPTDRVQIEGES